MGNDLFTHTRETFTTAEGNTVSYQDILVGIDEEITRYGYKGGRDFSSEDLKDLRQDAFKKAVISKGSYDPKKCHDCPQAYGYAIAVSCERDAYRKAVSHASKWSPYEEQDEDGTDYLPSHIAGYRSGDFEADRGILTKEALSYINGKIATLGKEQREVLRLSMKGYKPQKIAMILGCTPNAVSSKLCRARKALAVALGTGFLSEYGIRYNA